MTDFGSLLENSGEPPWLHNVQKLTVLIMISMERRLLPAGELTFEAKSSSGKSQEELLRRPGRAQ